METLIPAATVRDALQKIGYADLQKLSKSSGVSFSTLWRIRTGESPNPGIETVRKFWALIEVNCATESQSV